MIEALKSIVTAILKLDVVMFSAHLISRAVQSNSNSIMSIFGALPNRIFSYKPLIIRILEAIPKMVGRLIKLTVKLILSIMDIPVSVIWNMAKVDKFLKQPKFSEMI